MKTKLSLIVLGGMLLIGHNAMAQLTAPQTFTVSASVPLSTSVGITVNSINSTGSPVFTPVAGTALSFGTLTYTTTNGINIYLPNHYFSLDVAPIGGAGAPDTTVTYTEGANPNGATNGLGYKATATFAKEVYTSATTPPTETITALGKMRLIDLAATHEPYTAVSGGWLRIYIGIWTGTTTAPADPTNGQPFSNADAAGSYTGSLLITAVIN
jgi:hypothetical protein